MNRRNFILSSASAVISTAALGANCPPKLRFGVMTDTHVTSDPKSFERVKSAIEAFGKYECSLFCHLGDLAERCDPEAHAMWRETIASACRGNSMRGVYVYAAHDYYDYLGKRWNLTDEERLAGYGSFRVNAGIPNGMYEEFDVSGVPFVVVPQHVTEDELESMIVRAERKFSQGPVFVLNHVCPENTTFNSSNWGCWWTPKVLSRHPRVVNLSGHTHGTVACERNIWQGGFTSVDAGCLSTWVSPLPGSQSKPKESFDVLICEVYEQRIVMRRIDVRDGGEIRQPWVVPLPFDPASAPYSDSARLSNAPEIGFRSDAKLKVDAKTSPETVKLTFPAAANEDEVFSYRIEAKKRGVLLDWETIAREDVYGQYYLRKSERKGFLECLFKRSSLNKGRPCRFVATPVGFYGQTGKALVAELILR